MTEIGPLVDLIEAIVEKRLSETRSSMPAIVESFDPEAMTVQVRPAQKLMIPQVGGGVKAEPMASILDVPVIMPAVGGFGVTLPIQPGDTVMLVFQDRSIDSFQETGEESGTVEHRTHSLSDAVAIPGWKPKPATYADAARRGADVAGYDTKNLQIRSFDGKTAITVTPGGNVTIHSQGMVFDLSSGGIAVSGGDLVLTGGDVIADGISLKEHVHGGVTSGGEDTEKPK